MINCKIISTVKFKQIYRLINR